VLRRLRGGRGPRIVATYHSVGIPIAAPLVPIHRALARACDALVLMAEDAKWHMGPDSVVDATALIPNGATPPDVASVSASARAAYRARHGIPGDAPLLGQVGRMHPERRPEVYLSVLERVLRDVPDAHLLLAGGGIGQDRMERLIAERGLGERAHITGPVERVAEPLSVIDVYLTINTRELTGVAAMEASLARLPILAYQLQPDYVATDADWIWSSTDPESIGARAVTLLRDANAREALAARQHAHAVAHHSAEGMTTAYERLYVSLLDARRGRPEKAAPAGVAG
jgi:glycosyltransferase involved in cell wall biosynthesis